MSSKKRKRREDITALVLERGSISVEALAETLNVSTQTIRRDVDALCEGEMVHRLHGSHRIKRKIPEHPHLTSVAGTNLAGKRAIGEAAARLIPDGSSIFISIGSTPLSVAQALRRRRELTVITNNLSAAMALSEEVSNRIILPGGELRLPDRDILGVDVLDFFGRYRAEIGIFGTAGIAADGGLLEFHAAEVSAREKIKENSQKSIAGCRLLQVWQTRSCAGRRYCRCRHGHFGQTSAR